MFDNIEDITLCHYQQQQHGLSSTSSTLRTNSTLWSRIQTPTEISDVIMDQVLNGIEFNNNTPKQQLNHFYRDHFLNNNSELDHDATACSFTPLGENPTQTLQLIGTPKVDIFGALRYNILALCTNCQIRVSKTSLQTTLPIAILAAQLMHSVYWSYKLLPKLMRRFAIMSCELINQSLSTALWSIQSPPSPILSPYTPFRTFLSLQRPHFGLFPTTKSIKPHQQITFGSFSTSKPLIAAAVILNQSKQSPLHEYNQNDPHHHNEIGPKCFVCCAEFISTAELYAHIFDGLTKSQHQLSSIAAAAPADNDACCGLTDLFSNLIPSLHIPTQITTATIISAPPPTTPLQRDKAEEFRQLHLAQITTPYQLSDFQACYLGLVLTTVSTIFSSSSPATSTSPTAITTTILQSLIKSNLFPPNLSTLPDLLASTIIFATSLIVNGDFPIFFRYFLPFLFPSLIPTRETTSTPSKLTTDYIYPLQLGIYTTWDQINSVDNNLPDQTEDSFWTVIYTEALQHYANTMACLDGSLVRLGEGSAETLVPRNQQLNQQHYRHPTLSKSLPEAIFTQFLAPVLDLNELIVNTPLVVEAYRDLVRQLEPTTGTTTGATPPPSTTTTTMMANNNDTNPVFWDNTPLPNANITSPPQQSAQMPITTPTTLLQRFDLDQLITFHDFLQNTFIPSTLFGIERFSLQFTYRTKETDLSHIAIVAIDEQDNSPRFITTSAFSTLHWAPPGISRTHNDRHCSGNGCDEDIIYQIQAEEHYQLPGAGKKDNTTTKVPPLDPTFGVESTLNDNIIIGTHRDESLLMEEGQERYSDPGNEEGGGEGGGDDIVVVQGVSQTTPQTTPNLPFALHHPDFPLLSTHLPTIPIQHFSSQTIDWCVASHHEVGLIPVIFEEMLRSIRTTSRDIGEDTARIVDEPLEVKILSSLLPTTIIPQYFHAITTPLMMGNLKSNSSYMREIELALGHQPFSSIHNNNNNNPSFINFNHPPFYPLFPHTTFQQLQSKALQLDTTTGVDTTQLRPYLNPYQMELNHQRAKYQQRAYEANFATSQAQITRQQHEQRARLELRNSATKFGLLSHPDDNTEPNFRFRAPTIDTIVPNPAAWAALHGLDTDYEDEDWDEDCFDGRGEENGFSPSTMVQTSNGAAGMSPGDGSGGGGLGRLLARNRALNDPKAGDNSYSLDPIQAEPAANFDANGDDVDDNNNDRDDDDSGEEENPYYGLFTLFPHHNDHHDHHRQHHPQQQPHNEYNHVLGFGFGQDADVDDADDDPMTKNPNRISSFLQQYMDNGDFDRDGLHNFDQGDYHGNQDREEKQQQHHSVYHQQDQIRLQEGDDEGQWFRFSPGMGQSSPKSEQKVRPPEQCTATNNITIVSQGTKPSSISITSPHSNAAFKPLITDPNTEITDVNPDESAPPSLQQRQGLAHQARSYIPSLYESTSWIPPPSPGVPPDTLCESYHGSVTCEQSLYRIQTVPRDIQMVTTDRNYDDDDGGSDDDDAGGSAGDDDDDVNDNNNCSTNPEVLQYNLYQYGYDNDYDDVNGLVNDHHRVISPLVPQPASLPHTNNPHDNDYDDNYPIFSSSEYPTIESNGGPPHEFFYSNDNVDAHQPDQVFYLDSGDESQYDSGDLDDPNHY